MPAVTKPSTDRGSAQKTIPPSVGRQPERKGDSRLIIDKSAEERRADIFWNGHKKSWYFIILVLTERPSMTSPPKRRVKEFPEGMDLPLRGPTALSSPG